MKNYGTIPATFPPPAVDPNLDYINRAKQRLNEGFGEGRPWKEIFDYQSIDFPHNLSDAIGRIKTNIAYFRMNYATIVSMIAFLTLLWHPISLIVFVILATSWISLYFLRDEPLVVLDRTIEDWFVLLFLSILTIVLLSLTDATENILISLLIGLVLVVIHACIRNTGNLSVEQDAAGTAPFLARTPPPGSSA